MIRRIVEVSPLLKGEAKITADRITFPALDATHHGDCERRGVAPLAATRASACVRRTYGATRSERATRLWDEMITRRRARSVAG